MRRLTAKVALGAALIILGLGYAFLPTQWIEQKYGFEPDGGSGALELLIAVVPIAAGIGLLVHAWSVHRAERRHDLPGSAGIDR